MSYAGYSALVNLASVSEPGDVNHKGLVDFVNYAVVPNSDSPIVGSALKFLAPLWAQPLEPHPLFVDFIGASYKERQKRTGNLFEPQQLTHVE